MNFFFSFLVKCWKWTFIFNCEPGGPGRFKKRFSPGAPFPVLCQVKSLLIFLSSAKRVNNRESNIARGWSYSQQSNLYLKKAALCSLENPRILWSCQPLLLARVPLLTVTLTFHMELVTYGFDTRCADITLHVITLTHIPWGGFP